MEKNNLHKAYIYIIAIFAIGVAMSNIISFFNGVGFAFIGASVLLVLATMSILKDETNKKRFGDILVLIILEFLMFIVLFFAYDFNLNGITSKFPMIMRNICAIYSLFAIAYVLFRYISEIKGVKYVFVEYMLGNYTPQPKEKKAKKSKAEIKRNKELENGTLAPKPSSIEHVEPIEPVQEQSEDSDSEVVTEQSDEDAEAQQESEVVAEDKEDTTSSEDNGETNTENASDSTAPSNSSVGNRTNFWY